ncbi:hypothetical protein ABT096_04470 [Streptomyces sp. NPDC002561]|uniref:hypothetical protein n=1 Tax=unclassified Streptomyces TaxID=2593676 RepID=UPI0011E6B398|nr:hypothetical protein [Streptomyces sp. sk2.1]TXS58164.1 hypothetical protein EAO76_43635 [Streptomyces sp. sk2.1]
MTWRAVPGPAGTPADRLAARRHRALLRRELPRVRESALAWRNGLAALLAGLVGFGLLRGRSDIGSLAAPYAVIVGAVLLLALLCGAAGGLSLLRAAHGRPAAADDTAALRLDDVAADHTEALRAAQALARGVPLTLCCAALLTAAVGITWYGPSKEGPRVSVTTPGGTVCGEPLRTAGGRMTLRTDAGRVTADLGRATAVRAVTSCAPLPAGG